MVRLTREQVREVDRRAIEQYGIPGIVLMENAAIGAANVALEMLEGVSAPSALILCGGGNNGGDGLAVARHLHNHGVDVRIDLCVDPAGYRGDAAINWRIVSAMGLATRAASPEMIVQFKAGIIVDAIFGTGLTQAPRPPFGPLAEAVAASSRPVLAVDLPSGLDCDTGVPLGPCIRATRTVTFLAEKAGFAAPGAAPFLGRITVSGIGCPRELIDQVRSSAIGPG